MKTTRLDGYSLKPSFAAKGGIMMSELSPDPEQWGPSTIVVLSGRARHRPTGQEISKGWMAEFAADEPWDLEVLEDMTYWWFSLWAGPPP